MRVFNNPARIAVVLALAIGGFSIASIASGQSPMAVLTGTTTVTQTATATTTATTTTNSTTTVVASRKVAVCHRVASKKLKYVTIKVAQSAVKAHLRHGDAFGSCTTKTVKALKAKAHKAKLHALKAKHRARGHR